jgi:2-polyprenyl-6-methoxyphenol hydroxylase-like FAD-dependent oxidoreductase
MPLPASVDVLIAGAGPSGLALANTLARLGVPSLLVDRQPAGANTSRACVIHARTLEVLEPLAVVPELLARGIEVPIFRVRDRDRPLLSIDFRELPSRYPYTLMLPQCDTEAVLVSALEARGQRVWRPCELTTVSRDGDGVSATLRTPEGDHVVRANYVVGCDGMHSVVREQAGIAFEGGGYDEAFVLADVHMDWPLAREEVTLFYAPAGLMVVAPIPGDRFRIVATVMRAPPVPSISDIQALVETRGPTATPARVRDIVWGSRFHIQHRLARSFRAGRILLAGDAAHVHSPAGGQGMNTGIQDAVSLGDALAGALHGGTDRLLTEWAEHRRRIAADVVTMTDRMTRAATLRNPIGQAVRNAIVQIVGHLPAARQAIAMKLAELSEPAA